MLVTGFQTPAQAALPIQHWTQPNGARIYLVESSAIATVDAQIDFDGGSRRDSADKAGLASVMASLVDKRVLAKPGASALTENDLNDAWADLGAQFGGGAGPDTLSFLLRSLTNPDLLDKAVALAARELAEPAFPDAIWQRESQRLIAALKESDTRPGSVVSRAFAKAVYGARPYGFVLSPASVAAIILQTRPDQADQALGLVRQVVSEVVANGPTVAELQAAKDNLIGGFALRLDTNCKLLDNLAGSAWNDLPLNYLETWTQHIDKVTVTEITAAVARKL